jgi:peptidylprolyl isomerase
MTQVENGNTVKVHYTGTLEDGTQFDSSAGRDPLEFTVGSGQIIPGFEEAVMGMKPGDEKTVTIPSEQAYGPHHEELLVKVGRELIPDHVEPELGQQLEIRQEDGQVIAVVITEMTDNEITMDANHPLAGQDLIFKIELVAVG